MGLWDAIVGRSRPKAPNLDSLFLVPSAAITLETTLGLHPTGAGSVCYRAGVGAAAAQTQADVLALLAADPDAPQVEVDTDSYGFTWLLTRGADTATGPAIADLCTDLHGVNTTLADHGFATGLLCTLVAFADQAGRRVGLVYLYKQGTFYPFAPDPSGAQRRDNLLELSVRDALVGELPMEADTQRWLAVWGAPGL